MDRLDPDNEGEDLRSDADDDLNTDDLFAGTELDTEESAGGPDTAELIATRAELKRVRG